MSKGKELLAQYEKEVEAVWREMTPKSRVLCERAEEFTPGGALRSHSTGTYLAYCDRVDGCYMYDVDGNRYIDLIMGMTSIIGHNHPKVAEAVQAQVSKGLVTFMPDEGWDVLAEMMCKRVPSVEKVWPAFGGSQAFMWAIRAARAHTGRDKILKIWGGYHGTYDDAFAMPPKASPGLPKNTLDNILLTNWNDREGTEKIIRENKDELAAIAAHQGDPVTVAASTACLNIMTAEEIARINANGELLAEGIRGVLEGVGIRGQVIGYGNHQSVHLTTADEVTDPLSYLLNANKPGLKETMALFRRSLVNRGVITLEDLMALRVSTPLTESEIETSLNAMRESFTEIHPILKEVAPDLVA